jgi:hypothetical protein
MKYEVKCNCGQGIISVDKEFIEGQEKCSFCGSVYEVINEFE